MKTYYKLLFFLTIVLSLSACKKTVVQDDELTLNKQPFNGSTMRIDGYYYMKYGNPELTDVYFFYRNGIALYGSTNPASEITEVEEKYSDGSYYQSVFDKKYYWGLFVVEDSTIRYEFWNPLNVSYKAYLSSGKILNDSTIHITYHMRSNGEEGRSVDWTYHFKAFGIKPDSTNSYL